MCRSKGSEHFPQCAGRGWAVVALTDMSWMGRNNRKHHKKEKSTVTVSLQREKN